MHYHTLAPEYRMGGVEQVLRLPIRQSVIIVLGNWRPSAVLLLLLGCFTEVEAVKGQPAPSWAPKWTKKKELKNTPAKGIVRSVSPSVPLDA